MHVQVVYFNLTGITDAQFRQACDEQFAPAFASVPGLLSKTWLADPDSNTYGGVYFWRDREAMQQYIDSDLFKSVAGHPNFSNVTSREFGILEGPTRITHGLQTAGV